VTNKSPVQVEIARPAARDLKRLRKKYPHAVEDVEALIRQLESGESPGNQIPGIGYTVYKVRIKSSDLSKGKSGGYRVIYYIRTTTRVILITIYVKNEQIDITPEEIRRMIEEYEHK
jgi:mRNA-degrading endonuclease RelE of RelBE toxin-antitoxin system